MPLAHILESIGRILSRWVRDGQAVTRSCSFVKLGSPTERFATFLYVGKLPLHVGNYEILETDFIHQVRAKRT